MLRLWPRSIRGRDTLLATVMAALLLGMVALGVIAVIQFQIRADRAAEAERAGTRVSSAIRDHTLRNPIPPEGSGILVQVVSSTGHILFASKEAAGRPVFSSHRPPVTERLQSWAACPARGGGCYMLDAIRVTTAADSPVVYSACPLPPLISTHLLEWLTLAVYLSLVALIAWLTWVLVGRTLAPIDGIRMKLAEFTGTDLSRRVPEPPGDDEIARLARTANDTLQRLERAVEQQRRFASDASHELRTPIAGLRAQLEGALMYPDDHDDLVETLQSALRDTDRLAAIVDDLLLLARLGTGTAAGELIDLTGLVRAELKRLEDRVTVGTDLEPGVAVNGVRIQLVRVLDNLLDNAEHYGGGAIDVVVRRKGEQAVLMVTDRGPGIPEADRERVFERFTRLDAARSRTTGGTGLGLAIARDIAMAHDGTLRIEDSPFGTRFVLRLPLA